MSMGANYYLVRVCAQIFSKNATEVDHLIAVTTSRLKASRVPIRYLKGRVLLFSGPQRGRLRLVVGCVSLTVTLKLQVVPAELVQVTIVSPSAKKIPTGDHT
jgi:hypothetical protein